IDSPPMAASCLTQPFMSQKYATTNFGDFQTTWTPAAGIWMVDNGVLRETVQAGLADAYPSGVLTNFRAAASVKTESGMTGGALEIAFRVQDTAPSMYHCNLEPNDGNFQIQMTTNGTGGPVLGTSVMLVGLQPNAPYTMEVQVVGNQFECCIDGIAAARV